ncbi:MAG: hypothetical protein D4S01_05400, partial [Dehalococcoidia bacterium]
MFVLVNILKIKNITFGGIFDDVAFWYGEPFSFNSTSNPGRTEYIRKILQMVGLDMIFLFAGVSEVLTTQIVH